MNTIITRRRFLATTAGALALGSFPIPLSRPARAGSIPEPLRLVVERRTLEVLGRPASVFGLRQPDGTHGVVLEPGQRFRVDLENRAGEDTILHWHGQTPPFPQDGVGLPYRPPVAAGTVEHYDFEPRPGTHWMHSHHGLQEQLLLAAPLVVRTAEDSWADVQEVTVLLHDFTFQDPAEMLTILTSGSGAAHGGHGMAKPSANMGHGAQGAPTTNVSGGMPLDLNDVEYDAYLANDRTLEDPFVARVERGGHVRLRLISGATSTAFWIDLGALDGTVIAADGNPVQPVPGRRFPMTMGQRLDILVRIPAEGGAFPILARREGDRPQTGIVLVTPGAPIAKIPSRAETTIGPVDLSLEAKLTAVHPPAQRPVDATHITALTGTMMPYVWSMDDRTWGQHRPIRVVEGQRVVLEMINSSDMAHPMHLHGHHFQVVGLNGKPVQGAVRDTVLVPLKGSVTVAFDADNPGRWPLHCHNLLHMATGMMTEVVYEGLA